MLYECFPMAKLIEAAGGKASNGRERILDLTPKEIHARSPIFLGTAHEVEKIEALFKEHKASA
jgi:fructose-1,6-bisphosphatase I